MELNTGTSVLDALFNFNVELLLYFSLCVWVYRFKLLAGTSLLYVNTGKVSLQLQCLEINLKNLSSAAEGEAEGYSAMV